MEYIIAEKKYIQQLVDIRLKYLQEDIGHISEKENDRMREQLPLYFEKHLGKDLFPFIALEDNHIIASAFLLITEKPASPHFINGKTGTVLNVYTNADYRRRGIALCLMQMVIDLAKQEHLDYIELKATQDGYPLYQKCGFTDAVPAYHNMIYNIK